MLLPGVGDGADSATSRSMVSYKYGFVRAFLIARAEPKATTVDANATLCDDSVVATGPLFMTLS